MGLCLASAGIVKTLSVTAFVLAWMHSVEKTEWQDDWRVSPQGLRIIEVRIKGSGAVTDALALDPALCRPGSKAAPDALVAACNAAFNLEAATASEKIAALRVRASAWRAKGELRRALDDYDAALRLDPSQQAVRADRKALFHEIELQGAIMPLKKQPKP